ncbi:MAG: hypothetical protein RMA76_01105 [Deltaproteobacteria bacterium]|jgi:hypothetical protein
MRRWVFALLLSLCACGGEESAGSAPVVEGLTLSRTDVRRGVEFFASAVVMDVDGDLDEAYATFQLDSVDGDTSVESSVYPWDTEPGATQIDVTAGLTLFGNADLGVYELLMTVVDDAGHASRAARVRLVVEQ